MYRISRVFETPSVVIVKIAGRVADTDLEAWRSFLEELRGDELGSRGGPGDQPTRWTVLDFCEVSSIGPRAGETLIADLPANVLLLNGPTALKNMATSAGYSSRVLEPKDAVVAGAGSGPAGDGRTS
jgi:hypothetical protein